MGRGGERSIDPTALPLTAGPERHCLPGALPFIISADRAWQDHDGPRGTDTVAQATASILSANFMDLDLSAAGRPARPLAVI